MRKLIVVSLAILGLAALPKPADASQIVGTLEIAGGATIVNLGGGQTLIDFNVDQNCPVAPGAGFGCMDIQPESNGFFDPLDTQFDIIRDLSSITAPVTGFAPISMFQTITGTSVNFVLQDILSCPELGPMVVCPTGPNSAFGFAQVGVPGNFSTTVTMVMTGIVFDAQNIISTWTGVFTAQFPGQTIAQVLADFAAGSIDASISGTKVSILQVPEPATLALLGTGLFAVAARARRRRRSAALL